MPTRELQGDQIQTYFDNFTKRFLTDRSPESIDVEVLGPEFGDQRAVEGARLMGISYDPREHTLDIFHEMGDHRMSGAQEVWVREDDDGFLNSIEVVLPEGDREIINLQRMNSRRRH